MDQDYAAAVEWYRKAADQGLADAQIRLALIYIKDVGIPRDYWEAMKWSRLATVQGITEAEANSVSGSGLAMKLVIQIQTVNECVIARPDPGYKNRNPHGCNPRHLGFRGRPVIA